MRMAAGEQREEWEKLLPSVEHCADGCTSEPTGKPEECRQDKGIRDPNENEEIGNGPSEIICFEQP